MKKTIKNIEDKTGVKKTNGAINEASPILRALIQNIYESPFTKKPFIRIGIIVFISGILNPENMFIDINEATVAVKKYIVNSELSSISIFLLKTENKAKANAPKNTIKSIFKFSNLSCWKFPFVNTIKTPKKPKRMDIVFGKVSFSF